MGVAEAVACAVELESELTMEIHRARDERLLLRSLDGEKLEALLAERRGFEERAGSLQARLRALITEASAGGAPQPAAALGARISSIRTLTLELSELNAHNQQLAERALSFTKAYMRALSPQPAAYDRRGAESSHASALGSYSQRA